MIDLGGKTAIITGGSRGIGRAIALLLAEAGCNVVVNYQRDSAAAAGVVRAARRLGVGAIAVKADASNRRQVDSMVDRTVREFKRIDILVTNAGIWKFERVDDKSRKVLKETVDVNLLGTFHAIAAVVPHMKKQKSGAIINISSTAGQRGEAFHSAYAATKGAVISLTKSLAVELAPYNIRVNCVAPGWVYTDMTRAPLRGKGGPAVLAQIPMGRVGLPEEIAGPVLFLASDLSTFVTGEVLNVNGGAVLCG